MRLGAILVFSVAVGCGNETTFAEGYESLSSETRPDGTSESADGETAGEDAATDESPSSENSESPDGDDSAQPQPPTSEPSCEEDSSCDVCPSAPDQTLTEFSFVNIPQLERSGPFRVEFVTRVSTDAGNAFVALSLGDVDFFDDTSVLVRFAPEGVFDARDGGSFAADIDEPFTAGQWYHVIVDVDPGARLYDVSLRTCDGPAPVNLIENAAFRSDRPDVVSLDTIALWTEGNAALEVAGIRWD